MTLHEAIRRGIFETDKIAKEKIDQRIAEVEKELRELRRRRQLLNMNIATTELLLIDEEA